MQNIIREVKKEQVITLQNLGWRDRLGRFILGISLITFALAWIFSFQDMPVWIEKSYVSEWAFYILLIAIYPMLTGVLGFDPLYRALNIKSCGNSPNNPCGTFTSTLEAASGNMEHVENISKTDKQGTCKEYHTNKT